MPYVSPHLRDIGTEAINSGRDLPEIDLAGANVSV